MRISCPVCGRMLVVPMGKPGILLAGEFPGADEVMSGTPFIGNSGKLLSSELAMAGMSIQECRFTNLWMHAKTTECDMDYHLAGLTKEMNASRFVLLMGTEITRALLGEGVMELSGLEVKSKMFPKQRIFVSPNPAQMFYAPIGEFRLALSNFVEAIRKEEK